MNSVRQLIILPRYVIDGSFFFGSQEFQEVELGPHRNSLLVCIIQHLHQRHLGKEVFVVVRSYTDGGIYTIVKTSVHNAFECIKISVLILMLHVLLVINVVKLLIDVNDFSIRVYKFHGETTSGIIALLISHRSQKMPFRGSVVIVCIVTIQSNAVLLFNFCLG